MLKINRNSPVKHECVWIIPVNLLFTSRDIDQSLLNYTFCINTCKKHSISTKCRKQVTSDDIGNTKFLP